MCEPTTIMLGATIVGGLMSAKAQYDQGKYQESVADYNAAVDRNKATEVRNIAVARESEERQKAAQMMSRQRAAAAARGASVDFGTALDVQEDTAMVGEINAQRVAQQGASQAGALMTQASLTEAEGAQAARQGQLGAMSTLISTGGSVAGKWYEMGKSTPSTKTTSVSYTDNTFTPSASFSSVGLGGY